MPRVLSKPQSLREPADSRLIATGKVKLARAMGILLRSHPFHGHVASGWRARPESPDRRELAVGTMGVCWSCGGVQLIWNPEFVNTITDLELAGVLLHEVHHVVMRHPFLFPDRESPDFDAYAALVAEEVTVNEFVSLPLPGNPFRLEQFTAKHPSLKPFESTRERYRKLYYAGRARRDHEERQQFQKTVEEQLEKLLAGEGHGNVAGKLTDSHAGWGTFKDGGAAAALAVAVATAQAMKLHGHTLSPGLQKLLKSLHAGGAPGTVPGGMLESLAGTARARLQWQSILRQLLAVDHDREQTYLRPPRRFPDLVGVLPGSRRVPLKLRILAAIDTSGSMSASTLDKIAAELRVMARSYDVAVVEFDAAIQRRYRLGDAHSRNLCSRDPADLAGDPLAAMQGRGGTSFHPVFHRDTLAWAADGGDLSGVVVFTDGYGPAPEKPPQEQVIWVLMGQDVRQPARWGRAIRAESHS